jgi:hypothetical protein
MSEFKGTKEKWELRNDPIEKSNGFKSIDIGYYHCTYYGSGKKFEDDFCDETKANALLISKAPEMLEMLKRCDKTFNGKFQKLHMEIKQLIKEATEL